MILKGDLRSMLSEAIQNEGLIKNLNLKSATELEYLNTKINFKKVYKGYWTKEIFKVVEIKETNPIMYQIQDLNNENIQGSFYAEELQRSWF